MVYFGSESKFMTDTKEKKTATKKTTEKTPVKKSGKQAVILMGGKQYIVSENDELSVEKIDTKEKGAFEVKDVLAVINGDEIEIGSPRAKAKVTAEVIEHGRGEKIHVIKYKPKVRYRRKIGHRQAYTKIKITSIA